MKKALLLVFIALTVTALVTTINCTSDTNEDSVVKPDTSTIDLKGKYLATIGVCSACHTPPITGNTQNGKTPADSSMTDLHGRTDPDWYANLDSTMEMAGGVPFWLRFDSSTNGVVYSKNITQDTATGIGSWTDEEIYNVIKTGKRKDGSNLFLFAPHSFFKHLADDDVKAIVAYLKTLKPINHLVPAANLPFPTAADSLIVIASSPKGRSVERGHYLTEALVGCAECHSHTDKNGVLQRFAGGNPVDPFFGVFKLGPDLPLRSSERGYAAFPYPGYALLYSGNLTRFGIGGDKNAVPDKTIVKAMRKGVLIEPDMYGRPVPMEHVMMWQYYRYMSDDDIYSIVSYIKSLNYIPNSARSGLVLFGEDWEGAFNMQFGQRPSAKDKALFGK